MSAEDQKALEQMEATGWRWTPGPPRLLIDPRTGDKLTPAEAVDRHLEQVTLMLQVLEAGRDREIARSHAAWLAGVLHDLRQRGWTIEPPS